MNELTFTMTKYSLSNTYQHRVRYADTDKMGVVYNANYLNYFEIGRTELIRDYGMPYSLIEEQGYHLPLINAELDFIKPARYDDMILINTRIDYNSDNVRLEFKYLIDCNGDTLCKGQTTHVFIRSADNRPTKAPDFFNQRLAEYHA